MAENIFPYELPENWQWATLGNVCSFIGGGTPNKKISKYWNGNIFWASVKDIKGDYLFNTIDRITEAGLKNSSANLCEVGDVILVTRISPATSIISKIATAINQDLKIVKTSLQPQFLHYFFENFKNDLESMASGSTVKGITIEKLKKFPIPLPPLDEQKRIVAVIERLFSKLDAAKSIVQKILDGYELRRAAIFHKAFTGELTKNFRAEHGLTLEDWQEKKLGDVLFPTENTKPIGKNFRYIDIDSIDNKRQQVRSPKIIETEKAPSRAIRKIKEDDVLFSMVRPYLKNIALIDENLQDCIASSGFFVCRCKGNISSKFLYNFLCSENAISYLMQFMKGDNSPSIRKEEFLSLSVNLPPINEQKEIVRVLDSLLDKEQRTKEIAEKILSNIDLLKRTILARAFRGELGTKATVKKM